MDSTQIPKIPLPFWKTKMFLNSLWSKPCFTTDPFLYPLTPKDHLCLHFAPLNSDVVIHKDKHPAVYAPAGISLTNALFKILLSLLCRQFVKRTHDKKTKNKKNLNDQQVTGQKISQQTERVGQKEICVSSNQAAKYKVVLLLFLLFFTHQLPASFTYYGNQL